MPMVAGIGNALLAAPMVRQLADALPDVHVAVVAAGRAIAEVLRREPGVGEVHVLGRGLAGRVRTLRWVRRCRFDACLLPFPSNRWEYGLFAALSGARRRIRHRYPIGHWRALGCIRSEGPRARPGVHDVVQNLELLRALGIEPDVSAVPRFRLEEVDVAAAAALLGDVGIGPDQRPIALHAGSARTVVGRAKRWPPSAYGGLIRRLTNQDIGPLLVLEGPDEPGIGAAVIRAVQDGVAPQPSAVRLVGPIGEAAALLARCRLYVGSDSGLAHLAAAVGTPPVTLFAPSDPDRVCPFGHRRVHDRLRG